MGFRKHATLKCHTCKSRRALGGGNKTHIHLSRFGITYFIKSVCFKNAKKFGLKVEAHFPNFV